MIRHNFTPAKLLGCLLLICVGLAKADITQCIDRSGVVLYTDGPCNEKSDEIQVVSPAVDAKTVPGSGDLAVAAAIHEGVWAQKRASARSVTLDVETMRAARSSMLTADQSHLSQRKNLVALDQRSGSWFDFQ